MVTCGLTACTPASAPAKRSVTSMGSFYLFYVGYSPGTAVFGRDVVCVLAPFFVAGRIPRVLNYVHDSGV